MKEIAVVSGKGGTGKTTFTASLIYLLSCENRNQLMCDCDVEAPNLSLLLDPVLEFKEEFTASKVAEIDLVKCSMCGLCQEVCRFEAIKDFWVSPLSCEGCGFCFRICPSQAVSLKPRISGFYMRSKTAFGTLFHARLTPGQPNSGKLVSLIKGEARRMAKSMEAEWLVIDGPPGTGCPVIATLSGASMAAIVTEPSESGLIDLARIAELCRHFQVPCGVIINKYDLLTDKTEEIERFLSTKDIPLLGKIPYWPQIFDAIAQSKLPSLIIPELAEISEQIWRQMEVVLR